MKATFGFDAIELAEFGVCNKYDGGDEYVIVPVDKGVQDGLCGMLATTITAFGDLELPWRDFEPAEKYGPTERLRVRLDAAYMGKSRDLYATENLSINADAIKQTQTLSYYFGIFRDTVKRKLLGVRRADQFKGVLKAKNRLVRIYDDTLHLVGEDIFRLDQDFDYLICGDSAWILRPSGFERTAGIADAISGSVQAMVQGLQGVLSFVAFDDIATYAAKHRRAGRLVAALHGRHDLGQTSLNSLATLCRKNKIKVVRKGGQLYPQPGSELGFLEILDRRRYTVTLVPSQEEHYVAPSRHRA